GKNFVAGFNLAFFKLDCFGLQHQMREIQVPLMRRHIRTLGHETQIAKITLINHFPVIFFFHPVDFHGVRFVDQIKEHRKGVAQTDAAPATVTDIKHTLKLLE
ncbi:MAG: hypothetical protein AMJ55_12305, partial [Gammaproteobacteria bacterium SG8_15]